MKRLLGWLAVAALAASASAEEEADSEPRLQESFCKAWALEVESGDWARAAKAYCETEGKAGNPSWFRSASRIRRAFCLARQGLEKEAAALAEETKDCPTEFAETRRRLMKSAAPKDERPPDEDAILKLCAKLADQDWAAREQATQQLLKAGPGIVPIVRQALEAAGKKDLEAASRLEQVLQELLTETWLGFYRQGEKKYPFTARLKPGKDGSFTGEIREPVIDWGEGEVMTSRMEGSRKKDGVFSFNKQYDDQGHAWDYEGRLDKDAVQGRYCDQDGADFFMRQEK